MGSDHNIVEDDRPEEEFKAAPSHNDVPVTSVAERTVNLILDDSAFIRGIGNVKRWFDKGYVARQLKASKKNNSEEKVKLNVYIPSYTLHEFKFAKKSTSILGSNAREAIKLVDRLAEEEQVPSFEEEDQKQDDSGITYDLQIEERGVHFPEWEQCAQFQQRIPQVKDFPNQRTNLENTVWGRFKKDSEMYDSPDAEEAAEIPRRLKHLIRSLVYKKYMHNDGLEWKLVTEDGVTRTWARCFGIDCLNVNEAELLIFQSKDVTGFDVSGPGANFSEENDKYDLADRGVLHQWVDTTKYDYKKLGKDKRRPKPKKKKNQGTPERALEPTHPDVMKEEDFDQINYAPRAKGKLYVPKKK